MSLFFLFWRLFVSPTAFRLSPVACRLSRSDAAFSVSLFASRAYLGIRVQARHLTSP